MIDRPPAPPDVPAIELRQAVVGAMGDQTRIVIEQINWTVAPSEYWVVAGLQGSGKSDLLLMLGSLMPPVGGHYLFFGQPMPLFEESRLAERLRLGLVFETGQLFNHLTVWENIALPLRYHGNLNKADALPETQKFLDAMELGPWADSTPGAIGRNWQKRAGLARALILKPEVLLVDNPLAGLDLRHTYWWMDFLDQLAKGHPLLQGRPVTLILTTSDLRPWRGHSCRFAAIRNKHFAVLGPWNELETRSGEMVRELLMVEAHARDTTHSSPVTQ